MLVQMYEVRKALQKYRIACTLNPFWHKIHIRFIEKEIEKYQVKSPPSDDGYRYGDSDTCPEIYMRSGD